MHYYFQQNGKENKNKRIKRNKNFLLFPSLVFSCLSLSSHLIHSCYDSFFSRSFPLFFFFSNIRSNGSTLVELWVFSVETGVGSETLITFDSCLIASAILFADDIVTSLSVEAFKKWEKGQREKEKHNRKDREEKQEKRQKKRKEKQNKKNKIEEKRKTEEKRQKKKLCRKKDNKKKMKRKCLSTEIEKVQRKEKGKRRRVSKNRKSLQTSTEACPLS